MYVFFLYYYLQDLESQTDENTTPVNVLKTGVANVDQSSSETTPNEKRKADSVEKSDLLHGEENSATKKGKIVLNKEIKVEKP